MPGLSVEEHALGLTWTVEEPMRRSFHALVDEERVWLIDPIDDPVLGVVAELGRPAAVLQLLDRHNRDCETIAQLFGVPHLKVPDAVPDSPFETIPVVRAPGWKETALWWPQRRALIVAEVLGTNRMYTAGRQKVGMHLFLRPFAPSMLRGIEPGHLLVGHGRAVHGAAVPALVEAAHAGSRSELPRVLMALPGAIRG
ncbi:MAG: hypothetical protein H0X42_12505 [Solirubrobacterales bacterium]|nr:hypothetical protein [Solirubrobacterales bacterium]